MNHPSALDTLFSKMCNLVLLCCISRYKARPRLTVHKMENLSILFKFLKNEAKMGIVRYAL